jgi:hypothetical protein
VGEQPTPRELKAISPAIEIATALLVFVAFVALATYTIHLYLRDGISYNVAAVGGFALVVLGGCFDPVNFLWLCLPFTFRDVVVPARYSQIGLFVGLAGVPFFIVGLIGRLWWS